MSIIKKKCYVYPCTTNSITCPNKLFIKWPVNEQGMYWFHHLRLTVPNSARQIHICEDHFQLNEDVENWPQFKKFGGLLNIKYNVLPRKFPLNRSSKSSQLNIKDQHLIGDVHKFEFPTSTVLPLVQGAKKIDRCFVDCCRSNSIEDPKKQFFKLPFGGIRKKWIKVCKIDGHKRNFKYNCSGSVCEDHFNLNKDTVCHFNKFDITIKLKDGVIPHKNVWLHKRNGETVSSEQMVMICRLCLATGSKMIPIFNVDDVIPIPWIIKTCVALEVTEGDGLSNVICINCKCYLYNYCKFRNKSRQSYLELNHRLSLDSVAKAGKVKKVTEYNYKKNSYESDNVLEDEKAFFNSNIVPEKKIHSTQVSIETAGTNEQAVYFNVVSDNIRDIDTFLQTEYLPINNSKIERCSGNDQTDLSGNYIENDVLEEIDYTELYKENLFITHETQIDSTNYDTPMYSISELSTMSSVPNTCALQESTNKNYVNGETYNERYITAQTNISNVEDHYFDRSLSKNSLVCKICHKICSSVNALKIHKIYHLNHEVWDEKVNDIPVRIKSVAEYNGRIKLHELNALYNNENIFNHGDNRIENRKRKNILKYSTNTKPKKHKL